MNARGPRQWSVRVPAAREAAALGIAFLGLGAVIGAAAAPGDAGTPRRGTVVALLAAPPAPLPTVAAPVAPAPAPPPASDAPPPASAVTPDAPPPVAEPTPSPSPSQSPSPSKTKTKTKTKTTPEKPPNSDTDATPTDDTPPSDALKVPTVHHIWMVVLAQTGFDSSFGPSGTIPTLGGELLSKGTLLSQVHGIAHGALANGVALLSGQGPNPSLLADCPRYADVTTPGPATTRSTSTDQTAGDGCVFPATTSTLLDQLRSNSLSWRVYAEGSEHVSPERLPGCRHPDLQTDDPWRSGRIDDAYITARDPAVYFHSVIDTPDCATNVVGLAGLAADLAAGTKAPAFSYIAPNACHDGRAAPCTEGAPTGPAAADAFLKDLLGRILASEAFADDGLLIVTSDEGAADDTSGCCRPERYPNVALDDPALAATDSGGGRVGALVVGAGTRTAYVDDTPLNHFSLLRLVDDIFGLQPLGFASTAATVPLEIFAPEG